MYCVSLNITSDEWMRIQQAAIKHFPNECLSRSEIIRRYAMVGVQALGNPPPADRGARAQGFAGSAGRAAADVAFPRFHPTKDARITPLLKSFTGNTACLSSEILLEIEQRGVRE